MTGNEQDAYLDKLNNRDKKQFQTGYNSKKGLVIVDAQGNALGKKALKALGKTLNSSEKALFNAITDTTNHATINTDRKRADVDFGHADAKGVNTIDFADLDHVDASGAKALSSQLVAHETVEAYASATGAANPHQEANKAFGGLTQPRGDGTGYGILDSSGRSFVGAYFEQNVQDKSGLRIGIQRAFLTSIPANKTPAKGTPIPGHIVRVVAKKMKQSKVLIITLLLFTLSSTVTYGGHNRSKSRRLIIIGTVVAYDHLAPLFSITSSENSEILIVRIEDRGAKRNKPQYIKVKYLFWPDETANNEIDAGNRKWLLRLHREPQCDGTLQALSLLRTRTGEGIEGTVPRLRWIIGDEEMKIPDRQILRCYTLHSGDVRPS